jgi:hypothetical protein
MPVLALTERAGVDVSAGRMTVVGYDPVISWSTRDRAAVEPGAIIP